MSDHEFENYLTLISRFLRLNPAQREAIGEELRDHFESRLAELIDAGKSHHEAVRLALAEFGDAAGLAAEFTHISQARRRRLVMRCTVASVAALAAAVLVAMAVWPENRVGQGARNALAENAVKVPEKLGAASVPTEDSLTAETEAKLQRFLSVEVADQPLSEYMASLADQLKIQVIFDTAALRDATIDPSTTPVGLVLKNVRGKTLNVAYSPRGAAGAPVSMPLTWDELQNAHPLDFRLTNAAQRLAETGDRWREALTRKQSLERALAR
jgi:hypothetical protein